MSESRINLSDPDFEPSDEDLIGLARRAFAGVRERNEAALKRIREQIAEETKRSLRAFEERQAGRKTT